VKARGAASLERARAIWSAIHERKLSAARVAREFDLSLRQVYRYLELIDLDPVLSEALGAGRISMAHAMVLQRARPDDLGGAVRSVEQEQLSADALRCRLRGLREPARRLFAEQRDGFRLGAIRFLPSLGAPDKRRILEALESAADRVRADLRRALVARVREQRRS
jgi:hypothetical protein